MRGLRILGQSLVGLVWLVQALIPRNDVHQLVHWPDLVAHYHAHQSHAESAYADFWAFLAAHYLDGDGQAHPEHESLPLHHSHSPTYCLQLPALQLGLPQALWRPVFISRPAAAPAVGYTHTDLRPPRQA